MNVRASQRALGDKRARLSLSVDYDLTTSPPRAVQGLIDLLKAPQPPDVDAIEIAMQSLVVEMRDLVDAVQADPFAYVRTLLHRDERAEMLILTWLPGQRSPIHDHGASTCIMRVVNGVATERLYRPRQGGA